MKKRGFKKAQLKLSFGMIFSIILIIIFLVFAFYAIQKFLESKDFALIEKFANDLQLDVDKMWKGSQGSQEKEYILPKRVDEVCFADNPDGNLNFKSKSRIAEKEIKHIDINKIIANNNEYCVKNTNGKVKMTIKREFEDPLVCIGKNCDLGSCSNCGSLNSRDKAGCCLDKRQCCPS